MGNLAGTGADPVESVTEITAIWVFVGGAAALCVLVALFVQRQEQGS